MKVRLAKAWKAWPIGHVIPDMPANVARTLIARGIGEEIKEPVTSARPFTAPMDRSIRSGQMALKARR